MPPHWSSPQHPIVQRELTLWHKRTKRWRWLWILFTFLPCACGAMCNLSLLPALFDASSTNEALLLIGWMLFIVASIFQGFIMFGLWLLTSIGSATIIARERETQNWELLRLTTLNLTDVVHAKVMGIWHWLRVPIGIALLTRCLLVLMGFVALMMVIAFGNSLPTGLPTSPVLLIALSALLSLFSLLYFIFDLGLTLFYNSAIGTLASTWARTSANAVALMFIMHFVINFFIIAPLQQVGTFFPSLLFLPLIGSNSNLSGLASLLLTFFTLGSGFAFTVLLQLGIGIVAYALALNQAKKIND